MSDLPDVILVASVTGSAAFWLGLYATLIATAVALLTLYGELFQRVGVKARERFVVNVGSGDHRVIAPEIADSLGVPGEARTPILSVHVRNRGRRPVQIRAVLQAHWFELDRYSFDEALAPVTIQPGHSHDFAIGYGRTYEYSGRRVRRVYAYDGADRVYPLRERWLQRAENLLYRRVALRLRSRRRGQSDRREAAG